ncbi:SpoIIE family protein phosphatase [Streptomyces sp. NPDC005402]|uniref:SpoIIE family protein phosphatase n=1 Tax=Streptomyces sp. NPDC005402 TaxID=3155338 RepID=UPI0033AFECE1
MIDWDSHGSHPIGIPDVQYSGKWPEMPTVRPHASMARVGRMDTPVSVSSTRRIADSRAVGPVVTFVLDDEGIVTAWSPEAEETLGYKTTEVVGRPAAVLWPGMPPDVPGGVLERAEADDSRGRAAVLRHREGHRLKFELHLVPLTSTEPGGDRTLVLASSEQPLQRQEDQSILDGLFTQSPIGLAVFDTELRYIRMNDSLVKLQGIVREDVLGRRISEVLPELDTEAIEHRLRKVLDTGLPVINSLHHGRTPSDPEREHVWNVSSFALTGGDGQIIGVTDAVIDVTDRYWARERLAFLAESGARVGTSLDVVTTTEELVDLLVPRFADFAAIDLMAGVTEGEEPRPPDAGDVVLRHVARKTVGTSAEGPGQMGDLLTIPAHSLQSESFLNGQPALLSMRDLNAEGLRDIFGPRTRSLLEEGENCGMLVPLRARDVTLGLAYLHRSARAGPFERDDLVLAQELAARAAVCIDNARRYIREHTAAVTLHRSMLPHNVPDQTALDVVHCFIPAKAYAGVSGDWFDIIPLPAARVALVVGDVPGKGIPAAACMGQISSAVRTLAQLDLTPDELLGRLDDMVPRLVEREHGKGAAPIAEGLMGATCLFAIYDPISRRCVMASAGHPAPMIADPTGQVRFPQLPPSKPLGLGDPVFELAEVELAEGSTLLFHTKSLAHAWPTDAVMRGRLHSTVGLSDQALEDKCQAIADAVVPRLPADEDLAFLLVKTRALGCERHVTWDLPRDPAVVASARSLVLRQLQQWNLEDSAFTTELIISELVTNAIRYTNGPITLRLILDRTLICEVSDASSTSPHIRRAATTDEGGRGLYLIAQFSHRWGTRYSATGKTIWAEQLLSPPEDAPTGVDQMLSVFADLEPPSGA